MPPFGIAQAPSAHSGDDPRAVSRACNAVYDNISLPFLLNTIRSNYRCLNMEPKRKENPVLISELDLTCMVQARFASHQIGARSIQKRAHNQIPPH